MTSKFKPMMAYLEYPQYGRLKKFSDQHKIPMSQVIREAIEARIADGDRYSIGYNTALKQAVIKVSENKAAKMRFPSGKSFADLVIEDIESLIIKENHVKRSAEELAARSDEGSAGNEDESDSRLGL